MQEGSTRVNELRDEDAVESGMRVTIPGHGDLTLRHLVLDLNGTLALDGRILPDIAARLAALRGRLVVHVLTAATHGKLEEAARALSLQPQVVANGADKRAYVEHLRPAGVVAMGNGTNDAPMFEVAALAIAVLGPEGLSTAALRVAHVVVGDPCVGIDLLLHPARLIATLRA